MNLRFWDWFFLMHRLFIPTLKIRIADDDDLLDGQEISIDGGKSKTVKVGSADGGYITYSTAIRN